MQSSDLLKLLKESGAMLEGHFLLTSGRHSNIYIADNSKNTAYYYAIGK